MAQTSSPNYFSGRYGRAVEKLLKTEGGFVNHPSDPGGATNHGISLRFLKSEGKLDLNKDGLADFDLDMDGDIDGRDIRMLTAHNARELYHRCFWKRLGCEGFPAPLGEMLFDQAVNGGLNAAVKILQRALAACGYGVIPDGVLGAKTFNASAAVFQSGGLPALVDAYRYAARRRYENLVAANPKLKVFLKGWLRRAAELGHDA